MDELPEGHPPLPEGFNVEHFKQALAMGYDPWAAAICASPPVRAEKGPIKYRMDDDA